jgi:hypothetical protein
MISYLKRYVYASPLMTGTSETDSRARKMPEGDTGIQETHGLSGKTVEQTQSGRVIISQISP